MPYLRFKYQPGVGSESAPDLALGFWGQNWAVACPQLGSRLFGWGETLQDGGETCPSPSSCLLFPPYLLLWLQELMPPLPVWLGLRPDQGCCCFLLSQSQSRAALEGKDRGTGSVGSRHKGQVEGIRDRHSKSKGWGTGCRREKGVERQGIREANTGMRGKG